MIAKRYAKALFGILPDTSLGAVSENLKHIQSWLTESPDFAKLLANPLVPVSELEKGIVALCQRAQFHEKTEQFLLLLIRRRRHRFLSDIIREFERLEHRKAGIIEGTVFSPYALPAETVMSLRASLGQHFKQNVLLREALDKKTIGGLRVHVGSYVLDGSMASQLRRLKQALKEGYDATTRE